MTLEVGSEKPGSLDDARNKDYVIFVHPSNHPPPTLIDLPTQNSIHLVTSVPYSTSRSPQLDSLTELSGARKNGGT